MQFARALHAGEEFNYAQNGCHCFGIVYALGKGGDNESELDESTARYRSIISQKHAAQAAGLGTIGRHSLLITPQFGSMIWLGAVLTEAVLEQDGMMENICNDCGLCVEACPVDALENRELKQNVCWDYAFGEEKENWRITCHKCRDICPYNLGTVNTL